VGGQGRSEGNKPQPLQFPIGGSASLASTATGHMFLAYGHREQTWSHLAEELVEIGLSKAEQKKKSQALKELADGARARGYTETDPIAYSSGVTLSGYAAIAAPIFDTTRRLRFVLTLVYRTNRPHKKKEDLVRMTIECANSVSEMTGAQIGA
jgi:DNA-binding IclR family transcriptional regulator